MPEDDSIAVTSSASIEQEPVVETPSEEPSEPVAPTETQEEPVTPPATVEPEMFELPDGRKVDGATVANEYRNLLGEHSF